MNESVQRDAREFGAHVKAGGWRLGLLVARNVEKGTRGGDRRANRDRDLLAKVTATEFARVSGTTADRVLRYLAAWDKAAAVGIVHAAATLSPGDDVDLDVERLPAWREYYDASKAGGYNGSDDRTPTAAVIERAIEKLPDEALAKVGETVERERVERRLYPDRPRPKLTEAERRRRQQEVERRKDDPTEALVRLGTRIGDAMAAVRVVVSEYQDFRALIDDEEILAAGRERLVGLHARIEVALSEATEGSFDEALARLATEEV